MEKYSIWLIPPEPLYSQLKEVISELSNTYDSPLFEPHLTLVGNISKELNEIESYLENLALRIGKIELKIGTVSFSTTYFQSVLVRVDSAAELMQLNLDIKELFDLENNVFMPHMSLLYGNHSMAIREKVALEVKIAPQSFVVDKFVVTPATSDPKEWRHVAEIQFKQ
jgi:2'-5' RNA ligase